MPGKAKVDAVKLVDACDFIIDFWDFEANARSPEDVTVGERALAHFKCANGHKFLAKPMRATKIKSENFCFECKALSFVKPNFVEYFSVDDNSKSANETIATGGRTGVFFRCLNDHVFKVRDPSQISSVDELLEKCDFCKNLSVLNPARAQIWDYDKNAIIPSEVLRTDKKEYYFTCDYGHTFKSSPWVKRKNFCIQCNSDLLFDAYPEIIKNYWDYSKNVDDPKKLLSKTNGKFNFKCSKGHEFVRYLNSLSKQKREFCPECRLEEYSFASEYPELAKIWDYDKNEDSPEKVLSGSGRKFFFKCENGHSYSTILRNVINRGGCGICLSQESTLEIQVYNYLLELKPGLKIERNNRRLISPFEVDLYMPSIGRALEINGDHWHSDELVALKTQFDTAKDYHFKKRKLCLEKGVELCFVWAHDWFTHKELVKESIEEWLSGGSPSLLERMMSTVDVECLYCDE